MHEHVCSRAPRLYHSEALTEQSGAEPGQFYVLKASKVIKNLKAPQPSMG